MATEQYATRVGYTDHDIIIELAEQGQPVNHKHLAPLDAKEIGEELIRCAEVVAANMRARELGGVSQEEAE